METTVVLPVLDMAKLQEAANDFAMKGAMKTMEEFYTGYNSPYRKAIEEDLKNKKISYSVDLPDIIAVINDKLSVEIDSLANKAISETFVPMVRKLLTRGPEIVFISDILKEFIEATEAKDIDDCELHLEKHKSYDWQEMKITHKDASYELTLHLDSSNKNDSEGKRYYKLLSMPYFDSYDRTPRNEMKLVVDGSAELKMPFTRDVLKDKFTSYIANLVITGTKIIIDTKYFDEDMFPTECHCN